MAAADTHDLLVIGAGPGGYVAAIRAAQLGMQAVCIEREPVLGGTCLRVGCIPSKALRESSELFAETQSGLAPHGVAVGGVTLNLAAMLRRKDDVVRALTQGVDGLFLKHKVVRYTGHARIVGPGRVAVEDGSGTVEVRARRPRRGRRDGARAF
jgi:dihydrolipoamide dehydrogenase